MNFPELLRDVQKRPGAYGLNGTFESCVAFVNGCDAASDWNLLKGFREHLSSRLGEGANLVWWELVRRLHTAEADHIAPVSAPAEALLVETMFDRLVQFAENHA